MSEPDPLGSTLKEAVIGALLGGQQVTQTHTFDGVDQYVSVTVPSALGAQVQALASRGEFDDLLKDAVNTLTPEVLGQHFAELMAKKILAGLEPPRNNSFSRDTPQPGWLETHARSMAVEAATASVSADEELMEKLRTRVGLAVDSDQVEINLGLKPKEPTA